MGRAGRTTCAISPADFHCSAGTTVDLTALVRRPRLILSTSEAGPTWKVAVVPPTAASPCPTRQPLVSQPSILCSVGTDSGQGFSRSRVLSCAASRCEA